MLPRWVGGIFRVILTQGKALVEWSLLLSLTTGSTW